MAGLEEGGMGEKLRGQEHEKEISHKSLHVVRDLHKTD